MTSPETADPSKPTCFVLSQIGGTDTAERKAADKVLRHLIKKALSEEYRVSRADDDQNPGSISPSMIASILKADLIVADLSGHNPNVFYELAIAHGYRKPTVHIEQASEKIPFDVKDMRIVRYDITDPDSLELAQKQLKEYAHFAVSRPSEVSNPLSEGAGFAAIQSSSDPVAESNVQVIDTINALRREVRRAIGQAPARRVPVAGDVKARADRVSLRRIIDKVVADGRAAPEDFEHAITKDTSSVFDDWARQKLVLITGDDDDDFLTSILFHPDVHRANEDSDDSQIEE